MSDTPRTILVVRSHADYLVRFHGPLIRCLVEKGHRVIGACPEPSPAHAAALHDMGAEIVPFPCVRRGLNPVADGLSFLQFRRALQRIKPDLALFITVKPIVYGVRAARQVGCDKVYAMLSGLGFTFGKNGGLVDNVISGLSRQLLSGALHRCDGVLFHNEADREELSSRELLQAGTPTAVTHGSGVDLEYFGQQPLPAASSVLMIARLVAAKGVRDFAEAARLVRQHRPDVTFRLVGWFEKGPDAISPAEVQAWVEAGDLEFLGRLEDVRPALRECTIFALPTFYREGLPRTILEALAIGRPIITTDIPGCNETVFEGRNGHLIATRDPKALRDAILQIIADPETVPRMAEESRKLAELRFGSQSNAASVAAFMGV